jgi:hypothetical protein
MGNDVIMRRVRDSQAYKLLLEKCSPEDQERLEDTVGEFAGTLESIADSLFQVAQDPELSKKIRDELSQGYKKGYKK